MQYVKTVTRKLWHVLKSQTFRCMSSDPYSTHLPILIGLSRIYKIKSVLEFGSGPNSTLAFINDKVFPDLVQVKSFENDLEWYNKILQMTAHDPRISLNICGGAVSCCVDVNEVSQFDLVFVDDSLVSKDRVATIRKVLSGGPKLLVIHDFENIPYRLAVRPFSKTFRFKALLPNTGVYAFEENNVMFDRINRLVAKNTSRLSNTDVSGWIRVFEENLK